MNVAAALALQSIPFAALVLVTMTGNRDLFTILYMAALGLILSVIAMADGLYALPPMLGLAHDAHR
ncbi:hypothetical protein [Methylobacterium nigriterrae]|uniref:hypothetical protein n=1 Tax=Methylobacterium nigriterrae TaxID=3127512 RepID=UPI003013D004